MKRRDLLKTAILGTGAAVSGQGHSHGGGTVAANAAATAAAAQRVESEGWKPLLFDSHQNETVVALTDRIIPATDTPGAKEANVNRYIDLILHDSDPARSHRFVKGLGWLDGYAIRRHGAPFAQCTAEQQEEMLQALDGAEDAELQPGAQFFQQIKRLTVEGYYTSKIGIGELNKGGVPETFACEHEEHSSGSL